jgi:transposase
MLRSVIDGSLRKTAVARQFNTTAKTVARWVERFSAVGGDGLRDRSSKPDLQAPGPQAQPQHLLLDTTRAYARKKIEEHAEVNVVLRRHAEYGAGCLGSQRVALLTEDPGAG